MISEVFNKDCEIGMKEYPDKFFDLAIVDIPYGIWKYLGVLALSHFFPFSEYN